MSTLLCCRICFSGFLLRLCSNNMCIRNPVSNPILLTFINLIQHLNINHPLPHPFPPKLGCKIKMETNINFPHKRGTFCRCHLHSHWKESSIICWTSHQRSCMSILLQTFLHSNAKGWRLKVLRLRPLLMHYWLCTLLTKRKCRYLILIKNIF